MKAEVIWTDRIPERDSTRSVVYAVCFRPDGSQVLFAVGNRILVYNADSSSLLHSLKAHKDAVYALAYCKDNIRFASGSADKTVVIWTDKCQPQMRYTHNESVQCVAFNGTSKHLASGTAVDFGLWSSDQKNVQKYKVSAKVLCMAWTNDGQYVALGQFNGHISIRDKNGAEKVRIERSQPIWSLAFSPPPKAGLTGAQSGAADQLAVACWDETLSFYSLSGQPAGKEQKLDYFPCALCWYEDGEYLAVGGSDKKLSLHSKDGGFLKTVCERDDWVWSVAPRPGQKQLAIGCNDGQIALLGTTFNTVHGLFHDRYAHRETMTDVVLQHLITDQKIRVRCKDLVKKIAVYRDRFAVQLPDRVLVYETVNGDPTDMHYRLKDKINRKLDCNLLVVTSQNVILCLEKKLQMFDLKGEKVREWVLDAIIRYIRVVGGPAGKEGLLLGLKNGSVYKIFIDNGFPILLIKHDAAIRCLDLSMMRRKLALVDEQSRVFIYDLPTQKVLFQDNNANSVAWNTEIEDMLCFSGNGQLSIKTDDFPVHRQRLQGFVVGFKGSKIFCLHFLQMQTVDVPQSASMHRYVDRKNFEKAYAIACLGVTDADWRHLAHSALITLNLEVARQAFIRIRDIRYIELINRIEVSRRVPDHDEAVFVADVLAYQGNFDEAARLYCKAGKPKLAIQMYLDLRQWDKAKQLVDATEASDGPPASSGGASGEDMSAVTMNQLVVMQAKWLEDTKDYKPAADMYWTVKDYLKAIQLLGDHGFLDELMERVRSLNKVQQKELELALGFFRTTNHFTYCMETLLKLGDVKALMALLVEQQKWDEAFALAKTHPEFASNIYRPYADYLASTDRFEEAHDAYKKAGRPEDSLKMLAHLSDNAVAEHRYQDAAYFFWLLAAEHLKPVARAGDGTAEAEVKSPHVTLSQYLLNCRKAEIYFAFHHLYRYTEDPFTALTPEAIFQIAQFIVNATTAPADRPHPSTGVAVNSVHQYVTRLLSSSRDKEHEISPAGVSRVYALFALAKQGKQLGAFKLARQAFDRLLSYKLPNHWLSQIELSAVTIRAQSVTDREGLQTICYRCSAANPMLANAGDACSSCGTAFVRSFMSFEILPLVEFFVDDAISDEEAVRLLETEPPIATHKSGRSGREAIESERVQTLRFDEDDDLDDSRAAGANDPFQQQLLAAEPDVTTGIVPPIVLDRTGLLACNSRETFVRRWPWRNTNTEAKSSATPRSMQFFRSVLPEVPVVLCSSCNHFFHQEDYEEFVLHKYACPFCRSPVDGDF